jgi:hypothetical protein
LKTERPAAAVLSVFHPHEQQHADEQQVLAAPTAARAVFLEVISIPFLLKCTSAVRVAE